MKITSLIQQRFKHSNDKETKINQLAKRSSSGQLSSFAGVFRFTSINHKEKKTLENILQEHADENQNLQEDLENLTAISSEIKAINNQAITLHGERIKRAQEILKNYREGAFSSWLIATYGNRQTPYNFLQYFELYQTLPKQLQEKIDEMPKQAVYSLSSRNIDQKEKEQFVEEYQGETKSELLEKLRRTFPVPQNDKRVSSLSGKVIREIKNLLSLTQDKNFKPSLKEKKVIEILINQLNECIIELSES